MAREAFEEHEGRTNSNSGNAVIGTLQFKAPTRFFY
jgi:hypothetical protein